MDLPRSISLTLTHFNRYPLLLECIAAVRHDPRIAEIVISDDASTDGSWEKIQKDFADDPKFKLFRNEKNLDCYANKAAAVKRTTPGWLILFDSDNILTPDYLDVLFGMIGWNRNTFYCPEFAVPHFDYTLWAGKLIDRHNVASYMGRGKQSADQSRFRCALNTANYFVHRDAYLEVWDGSVNPHTADTIYLAYNWLKVGGQMLVVPKLRYFHRIHAGSHYKNNHHLTGTFLQEVETKLIALT